MKRFLILHWRFLIVLILTVFLAFLRFKSGIFQQDNYLGYTGALPNPSAISNYDSRLFPGLPILIAALNSIIRNDLISGYVITFLCFIGSYFILFKITKSKYSFLPLIFPPAVFGQSTQIATEIPAIFIILSGIYFFLKKKYFWASLIFGFGFWIRPIAAIPFLGIIWFCLKNDNFLKLPRYLAAFLFPIALFFAYNSVFFGPKEIFHQFNTYANYGRPVIGIIQVFPDLLRAIRWGWYRIFFSGLSYLLFYILLLFKFLKKAGKSLLLPILIGMTIFVFSVTSEPFLENLGRYLAPIFPLFWIVFYKNFDMEKGTLNYLSVLAFIFSAIVVEL